MGCKNNVAAFAGYLILSLVLTYPLAVEFARKVPGHYDVWQNIWNFWWVGRAVFDLNASPYYTHYIFHPTGTNLAFHTLNLGNSFTGALLARAWSLTVAYNTLVLLSFVLAGYGMFLLADYIVRDKHAAFAAGVIYAFSPYHFLEVGVGHLNLLSIQWIPFYILYMMKSFREGGKSNAVFMSLSFFAVSSVCLQYMGFMGLFTLLYLGFEWKRGHGVFIPQFTRRLLPPLLLSGILLSPLIYPTVALTLHGEGISSPLSTAIYYSQDAFAFVSPHVMHPILGGVGEWIEDAIKNKDGYGGVYATGYVVLALLLLYFNREYEVSAKCRMLLKKISDKRVEVVVLFLTLVAYTLLAGRVLELDFAYTWAVVFSAVLIALLYLFVRRTRLGFWEMSLLFFGLLSMGPLMHFFGHVTLPLPYLLLYLIPGFSIFRVPARFDVLFMLSAAVLSAKFLSEIKNSRKKTIICLVSVLILIEFLSMPLPLSESLVPEFYIGIALDGGDYAIMDVPISPIHYTRGNSSWENGLPYYMLYQTAHEKRMVGGYVSYPTAEARSFISDNVFLRRMNRLDDDFNESLSEIIEEGRRTLRGNDIRYVIVHKDIIGERGLYKDSTLRETLHIVAEATKSGGPVLEDESIIVYEVGL